MTRSERLAREGKIEVYIGSFELAEVVSAAEICKRSDLRYIESDNDTLYNGKQARADIYESRETGELFAYVMTI